MKMKDYDQSFNSAEYERNKDKEKSQKRRGHDKKVERKRKKKSDYVYSYYLNEDRVEYEYTYEVVPEHVETRVRKYYDPYAIDYGYDDEGNRVIKKRGREVTEVTKVTVPEKRYKRVSARKNKPTPKFVRRKSESGLKKFIKNLSKKRVRNAKEEDETLTSKKRSGHKRFWDHWLDY